MYLIDETETGIGCSGISPFLPSFPMGKNGRAHLCVCGAFAFAQTFTIDHQFLEVCVGTLCCRACRWIAWREKFVRIDGIRKQLLFCVLLSVPGEVTVVQQDVASRRGSSGRRGCTFSKVI